MGRLKGGTALRRKLRKLPDDVTAEITQTLQEIGPQLSSAIAQAAPYDTGRLADASRYQLSRDGLGLAAGYSAKRSGFRRLWLKGGFEALWQEFGTKKHAAQPFISPTFRRLIPGMLTKIENAVTRVLQKANRL